jgi:hypothetical protein
MPSLYNHELTNLVAVPVYLPYLILEIPEIHVCAHRNINRGGSASKGEAGPLSLAPSVLNLVFFALSHPSSRQGLRLC